MIKYVYKVEFEKSTFDLNEEYDRMSEHDKDVISDLDTESFFDYEENDHYNCYLITSPIELEKYSKILNNYIILHNITELSTNILNGSIDIEMETELKIDETNSYKHDFFIDDINNWILDNLEIDMILDRINDVGINSLRDIENIFLKNYKL